MGLYRRILRAGEIVTSSPSRWERLAGTLVRVRTSGLYLTDDEKTRWARRVRRMPQMWREWIADQLIKAGSDRKPKGPGPGVRP